LRNIRRLPDTNVADTLSRIKSLMKNGTLAPRRLARFATVEPPRVRALVGALAETVGDHSEAVDSLRKSLNPLTTFKVHATRDVLPTGPEWQLA